MIEHPYSKGRVHPQARTSKSRGLYGSLSREWPPAMAMRVTWSPNGRGKMTVTVRGGTSHHTAWSSAIGGNAATQKHATVQTHAPLNRRTPLNCGAPRPLPPPSDSPGRAGAMAGV